MESNEEYLLRTLRRTTSGLTDSLIPAHGAKLTRLLDRFDASDRITDEVRTLMQVQGFGKCALAMEWLLERTKRTEDYFSPEQFESDVLLLNEKLFEAFLNQPFDMPDYSHTFEAPVRPIQHIQVSDEEFMGTSYPATPAEPASTEPEWNSDTTVTDPYTASAGTETTATEDPFLSGLNDPFLETSSDAAPSDPFAAFRSPAPAEGPSDTISADASVEPESTFSDPFASSAADVSADPFGGPAYTSTPEMSEPADEASPSLKESMTADLFEASERVAQTATEFIDKPVMDRPIAMAVFRVTVRAASESAKIGGNVVAEDLFQAILKLIAYTDEQGKIRSDSFALVIQDIGDRLKIALQEPSGGVMLLKNLTKHLNDPKELLASR